MSNEEQFATLIELQEEIVRLLAAIFGREYDSAAAAAVALSQLGFTNSRVGQLLGVPTDSVRKAVTRAKNKQ